MHGHLDIPADSLGIEGFVVDGRTYSFTLGASSRRCSASRSCSYRRVRRQADLALDGPRLGRVRRDGDPTVLARAGLALVSAMLRRRASGSSAPAAGLARRLPDDLWLMAYGYIAYRYTSELACLVVGGAVAVALGASDGHFALRVLAAGARVGGLTVFSLLAYTAVGYSIAANTTGFRARVLPRPAPPSGSAPAWQSFVNASPGDPIGGKADEVDPWRLRRPRLEHRRGGDPWGAGAGARHRRRRPHRSPDPARHLPVDGELPPARSSATPRWAPTGPPGSCSCVTANAGRDNGSTSLPWPRCASVRATSPSWMFAEISPTAGGFFDYVPTASSTHAQRPVFGHVVLTPQVLDASSGLTVSPADTLPLPLCQQSPTPPARPSCRRLTSRHLPQLARRQAPRRRRLRAVRRGIARRLVTRGHEVTVFCARYPGAAARSTDHGVQVVDGAGG